MFRKGRTRLYILLRLYGDAFQYNNQIVMTRECKALIIKQYQSLQDDWEHDDKKWTNAGLSVEVGDAYASRAAS